MMTPDELAAYRVHVDAERGRRSLAHYMKIAWAQVEPNPLRWNWHLDAMADFLEALYEGEFKAGLINIPPGMTKSLTVSTLFPNWVWLNQPSTRFIVATYAQELSEKNAKLQRDLLMTEWHQERWPHVKLDAQSSKRVRMFENNHKGWRFSSSVGGQMTGRHGDYLIFDDLVKAQDADGRNLIDPVAIGKANDFWFKTMHTRRANAKETRKLGIMQRLHFEDTAQKCIDSGEYKVLMLPMEYDPKRRCVIFFPNRKEKRFITDPRKEEGELLDPSRFPKEVVDQDRKVLGSTSFEAQMQQNPAPASGNIFKRDWLRRWTSPPAVNRTIITVDAAFKDDKTSDYVAIQAWGVKDPNYYLLDQIHGRFNVLKTCEKILEMKRRHPTAVGVYVEDKANGPAVMQILKGHMSGVVPWNPKSSKLARAESVAAVFESGNVWVPSDEAAAWIGPYITELTRFPLVKNDDQVDATTMALLILHQPQHRRYTDAIRKMVRGG